MKFIYGLAVLMFVSCLTGCAAVRTYSEDRDRVDQNLSQGNQGYLMGQSTEPLPERKMTRKHYVTEIELGFPHKKKTKKTPGVQDQEKMTVEAVREPEGEPVIETMASEATVPAGSAAVTSYTVEPNDTLQKISLKIYGTSKKWKKIYDANSDRLKSPDRIYAGQVLNIPQE